MKKASRFGVTRWFAAAAISTITAIAVASPAAADTSDAWITAKTKMALLSDPLVSGFGLNVDTIDGRVTLHGKVTTQAEKKQAETVAAKVDGVTSVTNLLQVVAIEHQEQVEQSDERLTEVLRKKFDSDPHLRDSGIRVKSVNDGAVLVAGEAKHIGAEVRAMRVVRRTAGVRSVASEVRTADRLGDEPVGRRDEPQADGKAVPKVGASGDVGGGFDDIWVTSAVKLQLLATEDVPGLDINVDTNDGVVTLFGIVPTDTAKRRAQVETEKVDGVKKVDNVLQVVARSQRDVVEVADRDLERLVEQRLAAANLGANIEVEVHNGVVRLTGPVLHNSERLRAATLARSVDGVRAVRSDLRPPS